MSNAELLKNAQTMFYMIPKVIINTLYKSDIYEYNKEMNTFESTVFLYENIFIV